MLKSPCKDCELRHVGCHSSCEKYKAFDEQMSIIRAKRMARAEEESAYSDVTKRAWCHWRRKKSRGKWGSSEQ